MPGRRWMSGVMLLLLLPIGFPAGAQTGRESAQKAFDRGIRYQTGKGVIKNLELALEAYRETIRLDPTYADAYYNLAQVAFDIRRFDVAEWGYEKYLRFNPNDAMAAHDLGVTYHKQGKLDAAVRQYRRVLTLDPGMAQAHFNLGNIYYTLKKESLALQEWDKAIQLDPYNQAYIAQRERISQIAREKDRVLSPDRVWWFMYGLGAVFVAYCIYYFWPKRR
jgi:tetratricopeptide (TPR) repeat protein